MNPILTILIISVATIAAIALTIRHYKKPIRKYLHKLGVKLTMGTLRPAIHAADKDKAETDKKNIVILNTVTNEFEPVQKVVLKRMAAKNRNTNNAAQTKYRKRNPTGKVRKLDPARINQIEKASVYVTQ